MKPKKRYTGAEKARIALEALKDQLTLNETTQKFGIHSTQILKWKKQLFTNLPTVFAKKPSYRVKSREYQAAINAQN